MRRVLSYGLAPDTERSGDRTSRQHLHLRTPSHTSLFLFITCCIRPAAAAAHRENDALLHLPRRSSNPPRRAIAPRSSMPPCPRCAARFLRRCSCTDAVQTRPGTHHPSDFGMPSCDRSQLTSPLWSASHNRSRLEWGLPQAWGTDMARGVSPEQTGSTHF